MLQDYRMIAVVFKIPDVEELERRLNSRPGKHIPNHVMKSMINGFQMPTVEEGFDEIWHAE
jgi:gluconate kinase